MAQRTLFYGIDLSRNLRTGLKVDIFVDDCGSYERYGHPLLLWARNGYGREVSEFIPFLVSEKPVILNSGIDCQISDDDVAAIQGFIQRNLEILVELPSDQISQIDFVESVKSIVSLMNRFR